VRDLIPNCVRSSGDERIHNVRLLDVRLVLSADSLVERRSVYDCRAAVRSAVSNIDGNSRSRFAARRRMPAQAFALK
jgi:hypothetical protein